MKKIALIAALSFGLPAWSEEAKPPAQPEKPAAVAQEAPKAEAPKPKAAPRKAGPHRQEDARHCLEKASNSEIIKCAEAYL